MVVSSEHDGEKGLIYDFRLSSVGPGRVTGSEVVHEPTNMDLAMKLHYLRGVYFFRKEAVEGLHIYALKEPMFVWFNYFYWTCGRFRRSSVDGQAGRPLIKCNDCGARMVEAKCDKSIDEFLDVNDSDSSLHKLLVSDHVLGPDLTFSPLIFLQVTIFNCGGISVGLSWAHVLGDIISASDFINLWGQSMANLLPQPPLNFRGPSSNSRSAKPDDPDQIPSHSHPPSIKRVDPVGDHWVTANDRNMKPFSFHITETQLTQLQAKMSGPKKPPVFECVCAVLWHSIARIRDRPGPETVTVCRNDGGSRKTGTLSNNAQIISTVKAEFSVKEAKPKEVAALLAEQAAAGDERSMIEEAVGRDGGVSDFIMYGVNLTFVNLEDADLYGLKLKGQKPVHVSYFVDSVGDNGVVLVAPDGGEGRYVTVILPEEEVVELKCEVKREWSIA